MQEPKKYPEPLEALMVVLGVFVVLIIAIVVLSVINEGRVAQPDTLIENSRYFYIFGGSLFLILPLLYAKQRRYPIKTLFRLNPVPGSVLLVSIPLGLSLTILGDELDRLIGLIITIPDWVYEMMYPLKAEGTGDWILIVTGAVIVASVAEEFLFRGLMQVTLEKKGDATRAVLLASLTWTLVHQNPYWAVEIFILGVFIGFIAWRTNSVYPAIIVHGINNMIGVLVLNADDLQGVNSWYEWRGHVSPIVLVCALGGLLWSLRWLSLKYQEDSESGYH